MTKLENAIPRNSDVIERYSCGSPYGPAAVLLRGVESLRDFALLNVGEVVFGYKNAKYIG